MTRRILTIILAIALALIGTGAVLVYVKQADQRAIAGQKAVTVLVATQKIPAGTPASTALADGMLARQTLPASSVPADAVRSIGPALGALVMSADVPPGELLLRPVLVTSLLATSGLAIPSGMVAVTIPLCVPQAVANYVYPGSQVAVFDTVAVTGSITSQSSCNGTIQASASAKIRTRIMLTRVTVLAIGEAAQPSQSAGATSATSTVFTQAGNNSSTSSTATQGTVLVTLAVSQDDAERVITLAQAGLPWLALLTKSSTTGPDTANLPQFPKFR